MTIIISMIVFSFIMSLSPGPVNMVILSSGMNYGMRKTIPYLSGATLGFTLLLLFIGLGFFQVIKTYPFFLKYLTCTGSIFIIYVGYKLVISTSTIEKDTKAKARPKFYEGFLLQWLNPKAWIASASGAALYSSSKNPEQFLLFAGIYFFICYGSLALWALSGEKVSYLLSTRGWLLRFFNVLMGSMLIFTACTLCYALL